MSSQELVTSTWLMESEMLTYSLELEQYYRRAVAWGGLGLKRGMAGDSRGGLL